MAENETVPDILQEMQEWGSQPQTKVALAAFADRIERVRKQEQEERSADTARHLRELAAVQGALADAEERIDELTWKKEPLTPEQVRSNLGLLVDWDKAPGWATWAQVSCNWFNQIIAIRECGDESGYALYDELRPASQWVPKKGKPVYWWRGKDSGTGTYDHPYDNHPDGSHGHMVTLDRSACWGPTPPFYVERVEPLTKEDAE